MIYLTYNDEPSGIYYSQVIDVCKYVKTGLNQDIRLIAIISLRQFFKNRRKIKSRLADAIVIPMFPKAGNWKYNILILKLIISKSASRKIISRGIFATHLALKLKSNKRASEVIFDARGAYKAEFGEFLNKIVSIKDSISELERNALQQSDYKLAISHKLVRYWQREYGYAGEKHVVIPCTLADYHQKRLNDGIELKRSKLKISDNEIILVYAGSMAGWQSIDLMDDFFMIHLKVIPDLKIMLLAQLDLNSLKSFKAFPGRVIKKWVKAEEVHSYLSIADYGLLLREASLTNEVASPTKFAEYLNAGLKIIVSDNVGDFSGFVQLHNAGVVYSKSDPVLNLIQTTAAEKKRMKALSLAYFTKNAYQAEYQKLTGQPIN